MDTQDGWIYRDPEVDAPPHLPGNPLIAFSMANGGFVSELRADDASEYWFAIQAYRIIEETEGDIYEILAEREACYGDFADQASISQRLKEIIFERKDRQDFKSFYQVEALEMICHKMARIMSGDEDYVDSWVDIAGYATLVADRLTKRE